MSPSEILQRVRDANRAGRLPAVRSDAEGSFSLSLASHPLSARLVVRITPVDQPPAASRLDFSIEVSRRLLWSLIAFNLATLWPAAWLTDYLWPGIYAWYWTPVLTILTCLWMWMRWPAQSLADATALASRSIDAIRSRVRTGP